MITLIAISDLHRNVKIAKKKITKSLGLSRKANAHFLQSVGFRMQLVRKIVVLDIWPLNFACHDSPYELGRSNLFYRFLMVIDHIGRSKKLLFVLVYYSAYYPYTNCGQIDGPLLIHLR